MRSHRRSRVVLYVLFMAALIVGCQQERAAPSVELIDVSGVQQSVVIREINGIYGPGCPLQGDSWSLCVSCSGMLTNPPLVAPPPDSGCTLSVTSLRVDTGAGNELYLPHEAVPLSSAYSEFGSAFFPGDDSGPPLFVNVRIEPDSQAEGTLTIQLAYSAMPTEVARMSLDTARATSVSDSDVPPPDYWIELRNLTVWSDAHGIVVTAEGSADLVSYRTPGTEYVVLKEDLGAGPDFVRVDAAFRRSMRTPITVRNPTLQGSEFALGGEDLKTPRVRTIVISNEIAGVRAYRVITVSFHAP